MTSSKSGLGILLAGATLLLAITTSFTYVVGLRAVRANATLARQRSVIQTLQETLSAAKDVETGMRGYVIVGQESYLEPYSNAVRDIVLQEGNLREMAARNEISTESAQFLIAALDRRIAAAAQIIDLRRTSLEAAARQVASGESKSAMDQLRAKIAEMIDTEERELKKAQDYSRWSIYARNAVFGLGAVINLGFLAWAFRRINREFELRRKAAEELGRQKELLHTTLGSIGDGVVVTDSKGTVSFLNAEAEKLTGWSSREAQGKVLPEVFKIINEETRNTVENPVEKVLRLGTVVGLANHTILISRNGNETAIDDSAAPIRGQDGQLHGVVLVFRDFSEHKQAEVALKNSSDRLEILALTASRLLAEDDPQRIIQELCDGVRVFLNCAVFFNYMLDPKTNRLRYNACGGVDPRIARLIENLELKASLCGTAAHGGCRVLEESLSSSEDPRSAVVRSLGVRVYACHPLLGADGRVLGTLSFGATDRDSYTADDLSLMKAVADNVAIALQRKETESALRQSEEQFRSLAESIPTLAWWANADGYITWYNRRWYEFTGTTPDQMEGWGWKSVHDPEMLPAVMERWQQSIATGKPFEMEFPLRGANGEFHWFLTRIVPVKDESGNVLRWFGTNTDVTELRQARTVLTRDNQELERLVAERTAKLQEAVSELEHFSYTIVHDMRAPLRSMQGYIGFIEKDLEAIDPLPSFRYFGRVKNAAERLDRLIMDSLNYSRALREELPLEPVPLAQLLANIVETYPNLDSEKADISVSKDIPVVIGNPAALTQCFSNLLGNAVKFAKPGCKPVIRVWADTESYPAVNGTDEGSSFSPPANRVAPGDGCKGVRIWVEDNGIGIPQNLQKRIFGLFQRGSAEHEGTGIGLAIVRKVAERMGGRVGVESEPGVGSRFWVDLRTP